MHWNVVANSVGFLCAGLAIMMGGLVAALVLQAWWPLLFIPLGLALTVRIVGDPAGNRFARLKKLGIKATSMEKKFYGVFGDYFVAGPLELEELQAAEALHQLEKQDDAIVAPPGFGELPIPVPPAMQVWKLSSIHKVTFESGNCAFTIHSGETASKHILQHPSLRDQALKPLKTAVNWEVVKSYRKKAQFNLPSVLLFLPMFFSLALVFTALGIIQPNQIPLADWQDVEEMRTGKATALVGMWAALCESYLFLVNTLPAFVSCLLGATVGVGLIYLLRALQWTKVADVAWVADES